MNRLPAGTTEVATPRAPIVVPAAVLLVGAADNRRRASRGRVLAGQSKDDTGSVRRLKAAGGGTVQLIIDYVKQETLDPLKGLGRFVLFGVLGSVAMAVGLVILSIALLRVLEGETGTTFTGDWTWVPYLICAVVLMAVAGLAVFAMIRGKAARRATHQSTTATTKENV